MKAITQVRGRVRVTVEMEVAYDAEFDGPQVQILDFYALDPQAGYTYIPLNTLPRETRKQILAQIVTDARDKDRSHEAN